MIFRETPSRYVALSRLASAPRWAAPTVTALGLLAAVFESCGLLMFIPLVNSLGGAQAEVGGVGGAVMALLEPLPDRHRTLIVIVLLVGFILAKNAVEVVSTFVVKHLEGEVAHRLRTRIFEQALSSCIDYRPTGSRVDIVTVIANHSWSVGTALSMVYRMLISACMLTVLLCVMVATSPLMTLLAVGLSTGAIAVVRWASQRADATGRAVVEENKRFGLRMWESITALQLIRSFGREDFEIERFRTLSSRLRRRMLKLEMLWTMPGPIAETTTALLMGLLILLGGALGVGAATLVAFLVMLYRLQAPSRALVEGRLAIDGQAGAIADVQTFLTSTREPYIESGTVEPGRLRTGISFENVSFRYAEDANWALHDVSFSIPAGKTTAIVGASGAGKSTLMSLLLRFHDPSEGRILADGVPLPNLDLAAWRRQFALMAQEVQLFNASIEDNVSYSDPEASSDQVREALRVAGADAFIAEMPQGLDTPVGDAGLRLSGGQRQRVALARAVLRDPAVLLLDEATNALDAESERLFQTALGSYGRGRTIVVIAHRLSTVRSADHIVVLERGRLVEYGAPEELLSRNGRFAELHDLQQISPGPEPA